MQVICLSHLSRHVSPPQDHHRLSGALSPTSSVEMPTPERVFKVVFVGDSGVGKSSFIHRFCHDVWKPSFTATIGKPLMLYVTDAVSH